MKLKLKHYVIISLCMVILYTIIVTILTTVNGEDYSTYYTVFAGVFGGEIVCTCVLRIFEKEDSKNETISDDTFKDNGGSDL